MRDIDEDEDLLEVEGAGNLPHFSTNCSGANESSFLQCRSLGPAFR